MAWTNVGTIKGPKGDTGDKGGTGDTGKAFTYEDFTEEQLKGLTGEKGDTGAKGDTGDVGATGPQGETGAKGDTGATGATGEKGDTGDVGATGATGATGAKGDTGDPFTIYKTYESVEAMEADASNVPEGMFVAIQSNVEDPDNAKLYLKGASEFSLVTDMSGATGLKGDTGAKGDTGDTGEQGPQGYSTIIKGSYASYADLIAAHPSGTTGDAYLVDGELYVYQ